MPFTTVHRCLTETAMAFFRAISKRQDVDFAFKAIGILSVRNKEVTMRFYEDFLLTVDGTGKLLKALLRVSRSLPCAMPSSSGHLSKDD